MASNLNQMKFYFDSFCHGRVKYLTAAIIDMQMMTKGCNIKGGGGGNDVLLLFDILSLDFSFFSFPPVLLLSFDLSAIIEKNKKTFCIRGRDKSNDKKNLVPLFLLERVYKGRGKRIDVISRRRRV